MEKPLSQKFLEARSELIELLLPGVTFVGITTESDLAIFGPYMDENGQPKPVMDKHGVLQLGEFATDQPLNLFLEGARPDFEYQLFNGDTPVSDPDWVTWQQGIQHDAVEMNLAIDPARFILIRMLPNTFQPGAYELRLMALGGGNNQIDTNIRVKLTFVNVTEESA